MRIGDLIEALKSYDPNGNARAYEGEVCGIVIETKDGEQVTVLEAHETDAYTRECWNRGKR